MATTGRDAESSPADGGNGRGKQDVDPEHAGGPQSPEKTEPPEGFLRRLEQRPGLTALVALASFGALIVGVVAAVPDWREMVAGDQGPPAGAVTRPDPIPEQSSLQQSSEGLRPVDLVVRDPQRITDPDAGAGMEFTPPSVEFTVHNRGTRRSVINRVVVTVVESSVIQQCGANGEPVTMSAEYDLNLPLRPAAGTVLRLPVSQQQASDEADRFALRINTPERESPTTIHMYRLRFGLETDGARTELPVGTAVVAVPHAPDDGDGYFWSAIYESGQASLDRYPDADRLVACMKDNNAELTKLLSHGDELSPELSQTSAGLRY